MKTRATGLVFVLSASTAFAADQTSQTLDMRTLTCKDAIALSEDTLDRAVVWIEGYMSDEDDAESMVVDFSGTDTDDIKAHCQKNLGKKLLTVVEDLEDQGADD